MGPASFHKNRETSAPENSPFSADALNCGLRFRLGVKKKQVPALLIGFEGKSYDFSRSPMWRDGVHMGRHKAGNDLTDELKNAPHGREVIERFSALGEWKQEAEPVEAATKAFYVLAYMNLAFVFAILFVIALMKWGG